MGYSDITFNNPFGYNTWGYNPYGTMSMTGLGSSYNYQMPSLQNFSMWNMPSFNFSSLPTVQQGTATTPSGSTGTSYLEELEKKRQALTNSASGANGASGVSGATGTVSTTPAKPLTAEQTEAIKQVDTNIEELKKYKQQEDGSYKKVTRLRDASFGQVARATADGVFGGLWNMAEGFLSPKDPKTGKHDWGKMFLNLGLAAACVGATFIPVVGPFISAGLLTAGVVSGGKKIWNGAKKTYKLFTDKDATVDDYKHTVEDFTEGGVIIAASAAGIKSLRGAATASSTAASTAASSTGTAAGTTAGTAASTASKGSVWSWLGDKSGFKAATQMSKADLASIRGFKAAGNSGWTSFWKTGQQKMVTSWNKSSSKTELDATKTKTLGQIDTRMAEIEAKINSGTATAQEEAFLWKEFEMLDNLKTSVNNLSSKQSWKVFGSKKESGLAQFKAEIKQLRNDFINGKEVEINGVKFKGSADANLFNSKIGELEKVANSYTKVAKNMAKLNSSAIKWSAAKGINKADVQAYTGKNGNWFTQLWNIYKPESWKPQWSLLWKAPKFALDTSMIPFKIGNSILKTDASGVYKLEKLILPTVYEIGMLESLFDAPLSKEDYDTTLAQLEDYKIQIANGTVPTQQQAQVPQTYTA